MIKYIAGWYDSAKSLRPYATLEEIRDAHDLVFDPDMLTEEAMMTQVHKVNSEGNYHEFVFRLAFDFEKDISA